MTTSPSFVTICLPHFQSRPALLDRALASIQAQTMASWHLAIVDDGSGPGEWWRSFDRIRRHAGPERCSVMRLEKNRGFVHASNQALLRAKTPFVAFLHQDDAWAPSYLERMVSSLRSEESAVLAFCDVDVIGDDELTHGTLAVVEPTPGDHLWKGQDLARRLLGGASLQMCGVVVRREPAIALGGLDPSYPFVTDWHLWLRLLEEGAAVHVAETLAYFGDHPGKLTWRLERSGEAQRDVRRLLEWARERSWARCDIRGATARTSARFARVALRRISQRRWAAGWHYAVESLHLGILAGKSPR